MAEGLRKQLPNYVPHGLPAGNSKQLYGCGVHDNTARGYYTATSETHYEIGRRTSRQCRTWPIDADYPTLLIGQRLDGNHAGLSEVHTGRRLCT